MSTGRPLVLCAHGTRSDEGRRAVQRLAAAVAAAVPGPVLTAYVDVHGPRLAEVLEPGMTVVPLLLAPGHHTRVDVAGAADRAGRVLVAPPLGPSPLLAGLLADRLRSAGLRSTDAVVLGAAGSSDPAAEGSVREAALGLAEVLGVPVHVGVASSHGRSVADQVLALRAAGRRRVAVASYLLATGHFHRLLLESGADLVTAPVLSGPVDPRLVRLVLERAAQARRLVAA